MILIRYVKEEYNEKWRCNHHLYQNWSGLDTSLLKHFVSFRLLILTFWKKQNLWQWTRCICMCSSFYSESVSPYMLEQVQPMFYTEMRYPHTNVTLFSIIWTTKNYSTISSQSTNENNELISENQKATPTIQRPMGHIPFGGNQLMM